MAHPDRATFMTGAASAFATIAFVPSRAKAAQFTYKFGTNVPINDPRSGDAIAMSNRLRAATRGQVDIKVYHSGTLGGDTAMLSQIRSGALEFFTAAGGILGNVVPIANIEGVPFAFKNEREALAAYDGHLGAYIRSEIEAKGITVVGKYLDNGFRQVTNNVRPVATMKDIAGLKLRTPPGKLWVDLFRTFGAEPVGMNWNEVYTALQTHVVDGEENPYQIIENGKLYEVQKYLSITNHMWGGYWILANTDAWKALGPDLQRVVNAHMNAYADQQRRDTYALNQALADKIRRQGMVINTADVSTFKSQLGAFYARWKNEFGPKAWDLLESSTGKLA